MKNNHEVVLASVTDYGRAFEYASPEMKDDLRIVRAALKQDVSVKKLLTQVCIVAAFSNCGEYRGTKSRSKQKRNRKRKRKAQQTMITPS
mmetsp:Transcript_7338/g.21323  ORF Transcript_7338/g.21323 Transcript_7338/m.21323 type:complete len:90 (-) Transcript_7338:728-997(-)